MIGSINELELLEIQVGTIMVFESLLIAKQSCIWLLVKLIKILIYISYQN